jgi:hypothetical protein
VRGFLRTAQWPEGPQKVSDGRMAYGQVEGHVLRFLTITNGLDGLTSLAGQTLKSSEGHKPAPNDSGGVFCE